jgi:hypothetical protein
MEINNNLTEKEICQMALDVQNACNVNGVIRSYWEIMANLRRITGYADQRDLYKHCAVILFDDKIADLIGKPMSLRAFEDYGKAYTECQKKAKGEA